VINLKESLKSLVEVDEGIAFTLDAPLGQAPSPYAVLEAFTGQQVGKKDIVHMHKTGFLKTREPSRLITKRSCK
jgi:hypothetical protein